jgi:hypothetical protein
MVTPKKSKKVLGFNQVKLKEQWVVKLKRLTMVRVTGLPGFG